MILKTLLGSLVLAAGTHVMADTIHVPADHPTIQGAIDAASDGDIVIVAAGTYVERLNSGGRSITVRGSVDQSGDPITIVDGDAGGSVITINSGEAMDQTVFENLVVRNGTGTIHWGQTHGGGIYVDFGDGATFRNCHVLDNEAMKGGGLFCMGVTRCDG